MQNLTTVAATKAYLGITANVQDSVISALIARESALINRYCAQDFPFASFANKKLDGNGGIRLTVPGMPILAINSLKIGTVDVPASTDGLSAPGYMFDDFFVTIIPSTSYSGFTAGKANITMSWDSGYRASESALVPLGNTPVLTPATGGTAVSVVNVAYANGVALSQVSSNPIVGQYSFLDGAYSFNSADSNRSVTMTYNYVPAPIEQACIEMVGLDLKARDNLGVASKSLAGETITYSSKGITDSVKEMLNPFRRVTYG